MTDATVIEHEEIVGEPTESKPTKRDLATRGLDALDLNRAGEVRIAGGVSFATIAEVLEVAKLMAVSGKAVPKHMRANPGSCLAVTLRAVRWGMDPFAVADKTYEVNDRIAYEAQLISSVVNTRAPLQKRLDCEYVGELIGETPEERSKQSTLRCIVRGIFTSGDIREYESPMLKDIRVKNSPLWKDDPQQQLWYYAVRAWARKWVPEVILGAYTREELMEDPSLGREEEQGSTGLHARLVGSPRSDEGHRPGHAENELAMIAGNVPLQEATEKPAKDKAPVETAKPNKRTTEPAKPKAKAKEEPKKETVKADEPKTVKQYIKYATEWINGMDIASDIRARWGDERGLRNRLGVTADDRTDLDVLRTDRIAALEG